MSVEQPDQSGRVQARSTVPRSRRCRTKVRLPEGYSEEYLYALCTLARGHADVDHYDAETDYRWSKESVDA